MFIFIEQVPPNDGTKIEIPRFIHCVIIQTYLTMTYDV